MRSVLFPGLDSLVGLARHGVDVKPTLLRVLTDLYVQKPTHSQAEECQYVELALRLIDVVDADTRSAVARRLANYPNAPREILSRLSAESIPSAVGQDKPANQPAANRAEAPAPSPGSEKTKPAAEAVALTDRFFAADGQTRLHLLAAQGPLELTETLVPPAEVYRQLEASALGGRPSEFIRALERALGVTRTLAETIVNDPSGEPLLVAAKALAIPIDVLQRILLFVNPAIGHSVRRVYGLTAQYDTISRAAALRLVAAWHQVAPGELRAPSPSRDARPVRAGASAAAASRTAAHTPSRSSENPVTRNRDFDAPSRAPRMPSAHDTIKKMTS